jgi:predicted Zn-dependent protease
MIRFRYASISLSLLVVAFALGGCGTRSLVAVRDSGDQHYQYREYDAALQDYKEYIYRRPGNAHVHQMMGNTYVKLGEPALGCEQLKVAHALRMEDDEVFSDLCAALYADKKYDDLNRLLRERTVGKGRMTDWALLASYSDKLGDQDEAQRAWLTAAQVDGGKSVVPQLELAKLYMKVGDKGRARKRLAMAYYCDPNNGEIRALARELDEVPGPTYGIVPEEANANGQSALPPSTGSGFSTVPTSDPNATK